MKHNPVSQRITQVLSRPGDDRNIEGCMCLEGLTNIVMWEERCSQTDILAALGQNNEFDVRGEMIRKRPDCVKVA